MFYPDDNNTLRSITDASLGNDKPTGRSISGQFVLHGKTLLDWHSRHQPFTIEHLLRTLVAWGGGLAAIDTQKAVLPSSERPNSALKRPNSTLKRSSSDSGTGSTKRVRFT
ncbi:hypothetical protein RI054_02g12170 [Pseudoscourfieldia marina]